MVLHLYDIILETLRYYWNKTAVTNIVDRLRWFALPDNKLPITYTWKCLVCFWKAEGYTSSRDAFRMRWPHRVFRVFPYSNKHSGHPLGHPEIGVCFAVCLIDVAVMLYHCVSARKRFSGPPLGADGWL